MSAQKFVVKKKAKTGGKESKKAPKEIKPLVQAKEEVKEEVIVRLAPAKLNMCIVGASAMAGVIAACLKSKLRNIFMVAPLEEKKAIRSEGLRVYSPQENIHVDLEVRDQINQKVDLVILAEEVGQIKATLNKNRSFLNEAVILTTQDSLRAENIASIILGKENIVCGVLMFEASCTKPNLINYYKQGKFYLGRPFSNNDDKVKVIQEEFSLAFETVVVSDITCVKWTKLFINLYNCIPALVGKSLQETFADLDMARLAVILLREGLMALENSGIKLSSLEDFPVSKLRGITQLPTDQAAQSFSKEMAGLGRQPVYGMILERIKSGCPSDIGSINGEFAHLSSLNSPGAQLNIKMVNFVQRTEKTKKFFTLDEIKREFNEKNIL